jgi:hypothetical protein
MENYLKVVEAICTMTVESPESKFKDLPRKRLEWIFGFGFLNEVETSERHVFGLEGTFHNLKTEVYRLQSMVTYDPENQRSLLHQLWREQGKISMFPLNCLEILVKIITSNEYVMDYFAGIPSPTYLWARYTDWIRPQCNTMIALKTGAADMKE